MAKRTTKSSSITAPTSQPADEPESAAATHTPAEPEHVIEQQLLRFAQEVGRIAGTVHGKADTLLDRRSLQEQITRIRDSAAALLDHLAGKPSDDKTVTPPQARSGGKVDAPRKKHRKAPEPTRGVAHSNETIAKVMSARTRRPPRRG
jgi:hypothetical protein